MSNPVSVKMKNINQSSINVNKIEQNLKPDKIFQEGAMLAKCYYCFSKMDKSKIRTHISEIHPSKPIIFGTVKVKKSAPPNTSKKYPNNSNLLHKPKTGNNDSADEIDLDLEVKCESDIEVEAKYEIEKGMKSNFQNEIITTEQDFKKFQDNQIKESTEAMIQNEVLIKCGLHDNSENNIIMLSNIENFDKNIEEKPCIQTEKTHKINEKMVELAKCYYCSVKMDKLKIRTHITENHPNKAVIFRTIKSKKSELNKTVFTNDIEEFESQVDIKIENIQNTRINEFEMEKVLENIKNNPEKLIVTQKPQNDNIEVDIINIEQVHSIQITQKHNNIEDLEDELIYKNNEISFNDNFVKCGFCPDTIEFSKIKSHVTEIHGGNKILIFNECEFVQCSHCQEIMENTYSKSHMVEIHRNENPPVFREWKETKLTRIKCGFCGDPTDITNIKSHISEKHGMKKPLIFCEISKEEHRRIKHKLKCKCRYCGMNCNTKKRLEKHIIMNHEQPHKCDLCTEFNYYFIKEIKKHLMTVHNKRYEYKCDICEKVNFTKESSRKHFKSVHEGFRFQCNLCNKEYTQKLQLKSHIKSVHEGLKHKCTKCDKTFNIKQSLTEHVKFVHEGFAKMKCELCFKPFIRQSRLNWHMKSAHSNQLHFECNLCDYKGKHRSSLKKHHERIHLKKRDQVCYICGKHFFDLTTLKDHMTTHTENKIMYNVECDKCGKMVKKNYLKNHYFSIHPTEENIKNVDAYCHICHENFSNAVKLNDHLIQCDTDCKYLNCDICNKSSKQWFSIIALRKHIAESHRIIKTMCDICGDLFESKQKLLFHKRKAHSPKGKIHKISWKRWVKDRQVANNDH